MASSVLVFSGGCFAGKTTSMQVFKNFLGDKAVVLSELVRDKNINNIDDIRKDPIKYLHFQKEIISEKVDQERNIIINSKKDKIYLIDRALTDSLFYLTFYTNKDKKYGENFWFFYQDLIHWVKKQTHYSFNNLYDHVLEFKPLKSQCDDKKYRPEHIQMQKNIEFDMISVYNQAFDIGNKVVHIDLNQSLDVVESFLINRNVQPHINDYMSYNKYMSDNYLLDNTIMNQQILQITDTTIDLKNAFWSSILFTTHFQGMADIFKQILQLQTKNNLTKCHPIGLMAKKNTMIVGEAPGKYGESLEPGYLKPTFRFSKTSYWLKMAIEQNKTQFETYPYITNLCKYATDDNKISSDDFDKCYHIFLMELELNQPEKIVALGNNVYNYLSKKLSDSYKTKLVKVTHPSYCFYKGITQIDYTNLFKQEINNVEKSLV